MKFRKKYEFIKFGVNFSDISKAIAKLKNKKALIKAV